MARFGSNAERNKLIRKALAATFSGTVFEVAAMTPSGRNGYHDLSIGWTGGPSCEEVTAAHSIPGCYGARVSYGRQMTPEEREIATAKSNAEREQWYADAPKRAAEEVARKAAAKLEGIAKRKETAERKRTLVAKIQAAFPAIEFSVSLSEGYATVDYVGGPDQEEIAKAVGKVGVHVSYKRQPSPEEIAAEAQARKDKEARKEVMLAKILAITGEEEDVYAWGYSTTRLEERYKEVVIGRRKVSRARRIAIGRRIFQRGAKVQRAKRQLMLPMFMQFRQVPIPRQRVYFD